MNFKKLIDMHQNRYKSVEKKSIENAHAHWIPTFSCGQTNSLSIMWAVCFFFSFSARKYTRRKKKICQLTFEHTYRETYRWCIELLVYANWIHYRIGTVATSPRDSNVISTKRRNKHYLWFIVQNGFWSQINEHNTDYAQLQICVYIYVFFFCARCVLFVVLYFILLIVLYFILLTFVAHRVNGPS